MWPGLGVLRDYDFRITMLHVLNYEYAMMRRKHKDNIYANFFIAIISTGRSTNRWQIGGLVFLAAGGKQREYHACGCPARRVALC